MTGRRKEDFVGPIRFSREEHEELKRVAALEDRSVSYMVRLAVRQLLQARKEAAR